MAYIVAREWNTNGPQDFLAGWDDKHGTRCTGLGGAMEFACENDARAGARTAGALVPCLMGGRAITYTVTTRAQVLFSRGMAGTREPTA